MIKVKYAASSKAVEAVAQQTGQTITNEIGEVADQYVNLKLVYDKAAVALNKQKAALDKLRDDLVKYADDNVGKDEPCEIAGCVHSVKVGARATAVSEVNMEAAIDALGVETFMKVAKVGITDLRNHLTPDEFAAVAKEDKTGPRKITVTG